MNADGYDDVLVGAHGRDGFAGAVHLLYGPLNGRIELDGAAPVFSSSVADTYAGYSVAGVGDLDSDGYADIAIGALRDDTEALAAGAVYVFYGPVAGSYDLTEADAILLGERGGDWVGHDVAAAGDVNADGFGDLVIGAKQEGTAADDAGAAYLVLGPVGGTLVLSTANAKLLGESAGAAAGHSVAGAGDVDGDGYDDLLIGAPGESAGANAAGAAYFVKGPVVGEHSLSTAITRIVGLDNGDRGGTSVAGIGDVNGDGYADVAMAAPYHDGGGWESGTIYVFLGCEN